MRRSTLFLKSAAILVLFIFETSIIFNTLSRGRIGLRDNTSHPGVSDILEFICGEYIDILKPVSRHINNAIDFEFNLTIIGKYRP